MKERSGEWRIRTGNRPPDKRPTARPFSDERREVSKEVLRRVRVEQQIRAVALDSLGLDVGQTIQYFPENPQEIIDTRPTTEDAITILLAQEIGIFSHLKNEDK